MKNKVNLKQYKTLKKTDDFLFDLPQSAIGFPMAELIRLNNSSSKEHRKLSLLLNLYSLQIINCESNLAFKLSNIKELSYPVLYRCKVCHQCEFACAFPA